MKGMSVRRVWRISAGLAALACASAAPAQTFVHDVNRYRAAKQVCGETFARKLERQPNCTGSCLAAATSQRDRCLAGAERRYRDVLRRELRSRR
jgi:hypothetical protein